MPLQFSRMRDMVCTVWGTLLTSPFWGKGHTASSSKQGGAAPSAVPTTTA